MYGGAAGQFFMYHTAPKCLLKSQYIRILLVNIFMFSYKILFVIKNIFYT